jgi:hypothetical protein
MVMPAGLHLVRCEKSPTGSTFPVPRLRRLTAEAAYAPHRGEGRRRLLTGLVGRDARDCIRVVTGRRPTFALATFQAPVRPSPTCPLLCACARVCSGRYGAIALPRAVMLYVAVQAGG